MEKHTPTYSYNDLHRWSHRLFEKLGWMVLSYRDNKDDRVRAYLRDLKDILREVEARVVACTKDDEREEMLILYKNLYTLQLSAGELFAECAN